MKENNKYELRLRQTSTDRTRYPKAKPKKNKRDKFMNKSILSVMVLIMVMFMKMSTNQGAQDSLEVMKSLLEKQVDYSLIGQSAMQSFNAFLDKIEFLNQTETASTQTIVINAPLSEGVIIKGYEKGTHPLFSSDTAPYGISLKTNKGAFVIAAADSRVTSKTENADSTYRVVLTLSENPKMSVVYDGLISCYFDMNDSISASQVLGMLPSDESKDYALLNFGIYLDNVAQDPSEYLKGVYQNEDK